MGSPVRTVDRYTALKFEPHLHTLHSDGQDSVASMFEACKAAGYDAVALTDHNTVSGLPEAEVIARDLDLVHRRVLVGVVARPRRSLRTWYTTVESSRG